MYHIKQFLGLNDPCHLAVCTIFICFIQKLFYQDFLDSSEQNKLQLSSQGCKSCMLHATSSLDTKLRTLKLLSEN